MIKKFHKTILRVFLIISISVFAYSIYQLYRIYADYRVIEETTQEIRESVATESIDEDDPVYRKIDFESLLEINPDVKAWIHIPDTEIDEPVLLGESNDTYLYKDAYGKYSKAGSIFLDKRNTGTFQDDVSIIYGHNMANGSRFHDLRYYLDNAYYESHPYIYIYLPEGSVMVYEVFSSAVINAASELYTTNVDNLLSYHQEIASISSIYTTSSEKMMMPMILLSTCTSGNQDDRYVVFAMCIRKENPFE